MTTELHRKLWSDTEQEIRLIESVLHQLQKEAESRQKRISELRRLQNALAPFVSGDTVESKDLSTPVADSTGGNSVDKPVRHADIAQYVLERAKGPLHISDIITGMLDDGHQLPDDVQQRISAVYSAMLRRPAIFERVGNGKWGLVSVGDLADLDMASLAERAFKAIGRPATNSELIETLERMGYKHKKDRRTTYTSMHKAMVRWPERFKKVDGDESGIWELVD